VNVGRGFSSTRVIGPGATLGVLGSGQLGRMFTIAARRMGYRVHTFSPDEDTPTGQVADLEVSASYEDLDALRAFARHVDVVTFEFENVPIEAIDTVESLTPVRPSGVALHTAQQRAREKNASRAINKYAQSPDRTPTPYDDAPAASPDRASTSPAAQWRAITRTLDEHARIDERWLDYELDVTKLLDFPLMTDMRDPLMTTFHKAKLRAEVLRPGKAEDLVDDRASFERYLKAVGAEGVTSAT